MKKPNKPTGGKRLKALIDKGLPLAGGYGLTLIMAFTTRSSAERSSRGLTATACTS